MSGGSWPATLARAPRRPKTRSNTATIATPITHHQNELVARKDIAFQLDATPQRRFLQSRARIQVLQSVEPTPGFEPRTFSLPKCCSRRNLAIRGFDLIRSISLQKAAAQQLFLLQREFLLNGTQIRGNCWKRAVALRRSTWSIDHAFRIGDGMLSIFEPCSDIAGARGPPAVDGLISRAFEVAQAIDVLLHTLAS